jgi:hypothetical protein
VRLSYKPFNATIWLPQKNTYVIYACGLFGLDLRTELHLLRLVPLASLLQLSQPVLHLRTNVSS